MKIKKQLFSSKPSLSLSKGKYIRQPHLRPVALAIAIAFSVMVPNIAQTQTFTVLNTNNGGLASLRRAIFDANNAAGDDVIVFDPSLAHSTITLTTGEMVIDSVTGSDSLTITGPINGAANSIVIDAGGVSRIFNISGTSGSLMLENTTLTGGNDLPGGIAGGGAIYTNTINLIVNDVVITGNTSASHGGGIRAFLADVTINRSVISGNTSSTIGGGIRSGRLLELNASLIIGNTAGNLAGSGGGGLSSGAGPTIINQSTISTNVSGGDGGGLKVISSDLILNQSTVSGNSCSHVDCDGGGIELRFGDATINESTLTNNTSPSGAGGLHLFLTPNTTTLRTISLTNSILSGNTGTEGNFSYEFNQNMPGTIPILNVTFSLFGDTVAEVNGDDTGTYYSDTPDLGPLQSNGGSTLTHRPNASSYVLGAGSNALVTETFDQRGSGFARIQNGTVDMGAVERQTIINGGDNEVIKRGEMARALLEKIGVTPPIFATGLEYHDVQAIENNANWIVQFETEGYTDNGCEADRFCANSIVTREEIAKIYIKVFNRDPNMSTPVINNFFGDVKGGLSVNAGWIDELARKGLTVGCATDRFCPKEPVSRKWFNFLLASLP